MTKPRAALTELEGAILGVLRQAPDMTPYAVRKVFLASRSADWSGSAGAVYPAVARLQREGLLAAGGPSDRRGATAYRLSAKGTRAHDSWLGDLARASGLGIDPFRTRAAQWVFLPPRRRRALLAQLMHATRRQCAEVARTAEATDGATDRLLLLQLEARLTWLAAERSAAA